MRATIKPKETNLRTTQGLLPKDLLSQSFWVSRLDPHIEGEDGHLYDAIISSWNSAGPHDEWPDVWLVNSNSLDFLSYYSEKEVIHGQKHKVNT